MGSAPMMGGSFNWRCHRAARCRRSASLKQFRD
jgi:hypothetical protein